MRHLPHTELHQYELGISTPDAWKAEVTKMRAAFGAPIDDEAAKTTKAAQRVFE